MSSKIVIETRNGKTFTLNPAEPFQINYVENEEVSQGSNTRRVNNAIKSIGLAVNGSQWDEDGQLVPVADRTISGYDESNNFVIINGQDVVSVVITND